MQRISIVLCRVAVVKNCTVINKQQVCAGNCCRQKLRRDFQPHRSKPLNAKEMLKWHKVNGPLFKRSCPAICEKYCGTGGMEISIKQQMLAVLAADVLTLIDFCFLPSLKRQHKLMLLLLTVSKLLMYYVVACMFRFSACFQYYVWVWILLKR